ncbi:MAG: EamA family transporter [Candidatus Latescibacterota bacterium]|nr:EamA family transporter [Candidatus Latescibacterota bacterium]
MFELWVPISIVAAILQNVRSSLQKHLKGKLTITGATYIRFLFAVPFVIFYLLCLTELMGFELPEPGPRFFVFAAIGGLAQILGNAFLLHSFSFGNFVVATAYSKTETIQAAAFGILVISDPVTVWALVAILVSLVGVMLFAVARQDSSIQKLITSMFHKTAGFGFACGACFGIASVCYRAASLSLDSEFVISAALTLGTVLVLQTFVMTVYLLIRDPGQLSAVGRAWKMSSLVGFSGMAASGCWVTAMTIQNAAHVRALGQVELFFAFLSSVVFFREEVRKSEVLGVVLIVGGIVVLLLLA